MSIRLLAKKNPVTHLEIWNCNPFQSIILGTGYRLNFGKISCNTVAQLVLSFRGKWKSDGRSLTLTHSQSDCQHLKYPEGEGESRMGMKVLYTFPAGGRLPCLICFGGKKKLMSDTFVNRPLTLWFSVALSINSVVPLLQVFSHLAGGTISGWEILV